MSKLDRLIREVYKERKLKNRGDYDEIVKRRKKRRLNRPLETSTKNGKDVSVYRLKGKNKYKAYVRNEYMERPDGTSVWDEFNGKKSDMKKLIKNPEKLSSLKKIDPYERTERNRLTRYEYEQRLKKAGLSQKDIDTLVEGHYGK